MTIKPTRFIWADDEAYAAGSEPWSGQPNKVDPAAGRRAQGYIPELRPAAAHWNYLLNEIGLTIDEMHAKIALQNWKEVVVEGGMSVDALHGRYFKGVDAFMFIGQYGKVLMSKHHYQPNPFMWGNKGEIFDLESNPGLDLLWSGSLRKADIAEFTPYTVSRLAVAGSAVDQVGYSTGLSTTWIALTAGLTSTYNWNRVEIGTNWPGVFGVIAGGNGAGAGVVAYAQASVWVETIYTTGDIIALMSNKVAGSSHLFVCCSDAGELGTSADGITWSFQTISPAERIDDFAYSEASGRWVGVNTLGNLWISDDAGVTWARQTGSLPDIVEITGGIFDITIAANDKYCLVITGKGDMGASGKSIQWVSWDDGDTWQRIVRDDTNILTAVASGGGRFVMFGYDYGVASLIGDFGP